MNSSCDREEFERIRRLHNKPRKDKETLKWRRKNYNEEFVEDEGIILKRIVK